MRTHLSVIAFVTSTTLVAPAARTLAAERREVGNLVLENVPDASPALQERLRQYQNARAATMQAWDPRPDAGVIITTRFGETNQLHVVSRAGGARTQLTFFDEPVASAAMCSVPAGEPALVFAKDVGGGENFQLYQLDLKTGRSELLTDGKARHGDPICSHTTGEIAFYGTGRNGSDWDIYTKRLGTASAPTLVYTASGSWTPLDFSVDDKLLLLSHYISINESTLHILDVGTGTTRQIHPAGKVPIAYGDAAFSPDGKGVFFTSDEDSDVKGLHYYDLAKDSIRKHLTRDIPWNVTELEVRHGGNQLAFVTNEDGISRLYFVDGTRGDMKRRRVEGIPDGVIHGLRFDRFGRLAFDLNTSQSPGDIFVLSGGALSRWTQSEVGGLDPSRFVKPELVHFPTFDRAGLTRRTIPAFVYRPTTPGPHPVVIQIHGGPEAQFLPTFSPLIQYLVTEMNVAVIAPNVRGSDGYGKTYLRLDNGYKREDSVRDIGALLDWIGTRPELDAQRVAVWGGSYGGYMVLASMTHYNDRLAAGIDVVGISNFVTFLKNTQDYRRDLRRAEYGDERDPKMHAFLEKISPTNSAKKISKPMFVIQGLNDPRVPVTEAEQIVASMRGNGSPVWYMMAKDEGHGFQKKVNRDAYSEGVMGFLQETLRIK